MLALEAGDPSSDPVHKGTGEASSPELDCQAMTRVPMQDPTQDPWRSEPLVLPSYAAWFRLDAVHPIERRALPKILSDNDEAAAAYVLPAPP